ncbi:MAG: hypothetical protein ACFFGZ_10810 [Candidatus Thorarchaeota archaeon]
MTGTQAPYFKEHGYHLILTQTDYSNSDRSVLVANLILSKAILKSTDGKPLNADAVEKFNQGFKRDKKKPRVVKGGQSTLFALECEMKSLTLQDIVIKVYPIAKLSLAALVTHYVAVLEFKKLFQDLPIPVILRNNSERNFLVRCAEIFGFGILKEDDIPSFTVLLQEKSRGPSIEKAREYAPRNMSSITKTIAKHGFIIDPYPQNWRFGAGVFDGSGGFVTTLEYIDTLLMNTTKEQRQMIQKVLSLFNDA